jgi:branched-subunit amino acid transport protein AzlD
MSFLKNYICPACKKPFPFLIKPSQMMRTGFFSMPATRCKNCGAVSRQKIFLPAAIRVWPLTIAVVALIIYILRTVPFFIALRHNHPGIYGGIGGGIAGLAAVTGLRRGFHLVPLFPAAGAQSQKIKPANWIIPLLVTAVIILLALFTGRRQACLIGLTVSMAAWGIYYSLSPKEKNPT